MNQANALLQWVDAPGTSIDQPKDAAAFLRFLHPGRRDWPLVHAILGMRAPLKSVADQTDSHGRMDQQGYVRLGTKD